MAIFIFIILVALGGLAVFRMLAPDMYVRVSRQRFTFPWNRAHLLSEEPPKYYPDIDSLPTAIDTPMQQEDMPVPISEKLEKMERLLLEKNKAIDRIQTRLEAELSHRREFEKVKTILDEEIQQLKQQLRYLKNKKEQSHA